MHHLNIWKDKPQTEKIFVHHMSSKGTASRMYRDLLQLNIGWKKPPG